LARRPTALVTLDFLELLLTEFDLWRKIDDGRLTSEPVAERDAPSHRFPGAVSRIIKHRTVTGTHVATTHLIDDDQGTVFHRDAKDFIMYEVRLFR